MPTLHPVDHDPFEAPVKTSTLVPVDYDPDFADAAAPAQQPGRPLKLTVRPQDALPTLPGMHGAPGGSPDVLQDEPGPSMPVSGDPYLAVAERFAGRGGPAAPRSVPDIPSATNARSFARGVGDLAAPNLTGALAGDPGAPAVDARDYLTSPPQADPFADQGGSDQRVVQAPAEQRPTGKMPTSPASQSEGVAEDIINLGLNAVPGPSAVAGVAKALTGKAGVTALLKAVFAGIGAKTANHAALAEAKQLEEAGVSAANIWKQTGWGRGKGGDWVYEISDQGLKVKPPTRTAPGKIEHPELEAAYPGITDIPVRAVKEGPFNESRGLSGFYRGPDESGRGEEIGMSVGAKGHQARMTGAHELEHAVQQREGLPHGASPSHPEVVRLADQDVSALKAQGQRTIDSAFAERDRWIDGQMKAAEREGVELDPIRLAQRYWQDHPEKHKELHAVYDAIEAGPMVRRRALETNYRRVAGETQARNAATRLEYSDAERRNAEPSTTEDEPRHRQIVMRDHKVVEDGAPAAGERKPFAGDVEASHEPVPSGIKWDKNAVGEGRPIGKDMRVIDVDPRALDRAFKATDPSFYDLIPGRMERLKKHVAAGKPVGLAEVGVTDGRLAFTNGRTRSRLAAEAGDTHMPIAVEADKATELQKLVRKHAEPEAQDLIKPAERLREALSAKRQPVPRTIDQLLKKAEEIVTTHERDFRTNRHLYDSGKKIKSEITMAADRLLWNAGGLNQAPSSGMQRVWIRDRIARARELLKQEGVDVTPADLQAIWWYPEKELYAKLGGRDAEGINVDYASALRDLARKQGVADAEVERAVRSAHQRPGPGRAAGERGRGQGDRRAGARGSGEEEARRTP